MRKPYIEKLTAFITGVGGQDGSYLAEHLLEQGYRVVGLVRRSAHNNLGNIAHLHDKIEIIQGDVLDPLMLAAIVERYKPDEVYHEADQDNVDWSFKTPTYQYDVTVKGTLNLLEACRTKAPKAKIFIPCSAMMYGDAPPPQDESTRFNPQSPYATAKVAVYHMATYYRNIHKMHVNIGIMYNHDSVRRHGREYLLHRICRSAARRENVLLYNSDSRVTIGDASTFMRVVIEMMIVGHIPSTYVIGSNCSYALWEIVSIAYGMMGLDYRGYLFSDTIPKHPPESRLTAKRPGNPQTLVPVTDRIKSLVKIPLDEPITPLIEALVTKYVKNPSL